MVNKIRTTCGKFNIHFSGPSFIWNNPNEHLKSSSLHLFKQTMNEKLIFVLHTFNSG